MKNNHHEATIVSDYIRSLMIKQGWSVKQLSKKSGIDQWTLNNLLADKVNLSNCNIEGLAHAFGTPIYPWRDLQRRYLLNKRKNLLLKQKD